MKQWFRSGMATARMCLKESMYFGFFNLLAQYLLQAGVLAAMLMIWQSLAGQGVSLDGMTLSQLQTYTILSTALEPMLNVRTPASGFLHDGSILGMYQRPTGVFAQLTAQTMGGWVMRLCCLSLPVVVIAGLCGMEMRPVDGWFFLSLPLSISQGFAVDYLFACFLIRMHNLEWTVHSLREALTALLTGSLIPFATLPWGLGDFLQLSPLGTLAGAPLALFTGLSEPLPIIGAQLFWNLTLWPLALYCFGASRERMVSYGG